MRGARVSLLECECSTAWYKDARCDGRLAVLHHARRCVCCRSYVGSLTQDKCKGLGAQAIEPAAKKRLFRNACEAVSESYFFRPCVIMAAASITGTATAIAFRLNKQKRKVEGREGKEFVRYTGQEWAAVVEKWGSQALSLVSTPVLSL